MTRAIWLTDIHLNFVKPDKFKEFIGMLKREKADQIWLGGDIGEADSVAGVLTNLAAALKIPIYFVLGNHDFYNGSFASVHEIVRGLSRDNPLLHWLPAAGRIDYGADTALIGHGGWADGRLGDFAKSTVLLNDYLTIEDFRVLLGAVDMGDEDRVVEAMQASAAQRLAKLNALGDEAAAFFKQHLPAAATGRKQVYVLTHVPPFAESCWYEGKNSDANHLPHFSSKAAGDVLREIAQRHSGCQFTVLCGHTHGEGETQILPNLKVLTGGATYGVPYVQQSFELPG